MSHWNASLHHANHLLPLPLVTNYHIPSHHLITQINTLAQKNKTDYAMPHSPSEIRILANARQPLKHRTIQAFHHLSSSPCAHYHKITLQHSWISDFACKDWTSPPRYTREVFLLRFFLLQRSQFSARYHRLASPVSLDLYI
jgi:hypothetical protein